MLHITNGKSVGQSIHQTGIAGTVLTWDDVLHEGPTPAGLSLPQMSELRGRFIADFYTLPLEEVMADFTQRDTTLTRFHEHEEVVLWFEHGLYDHLQLVQLLDWFAGRDLKSTKFSLICINAFAGVDHFVGLGQLTPVQLTSLLGTRQVVTQAMLHLGRQAGQAYCSPHPHAVETLRRTETMALPFLEHALLRHLEEYPGVGDGLSRTERQILEVVVSGISKPVDIFRAAMDKEENAFMGDMTCWVHLSQLCQGARPLLTRSDGAPFVLAEPGEYHEEFHTQHMVLTGDGFAVLHGQADWITLCGGIDRWLGGVHLDGLDAAWRWDRQNHMLLHRAGR